MRTRRILINLFWFGIVAFLSFKMPYMTDDHMHMLSFADGEPVGSVGRIIPSVIGYYNTWGGRALSMIMIQFVLMLPRWFYALTNAAVYVLAANTVCAYSSEKDKETKPVLLALVYLFIWFFMPVMAEDTLWTTGSITYLWTNTIILAFGLIYYRDVNGYRESTGRDAAHFEISAKAIVRIVLMLIAGFCAGLTNEAAASALVCALVAYLVWSVRTKHYIHPDRIAGFIGVLAGVALLLLAPGNAVRTADVSSYAVSGSILRILIYRLGRESYYSIIFLMIPFAICVVLFILGGQRSICTGPLFWIIAFISVYVMTFSTGFANRIYQFPMYMLAAAFAIAVRNIIDRIPAAGTLQKAGTAAVVFSAALMILVCTEVCAGIMYSRQTGTFFDRHMNYFYTFEGEINGPMAGDGMPDD